MFKRLEISDKTAGKIVVVIVIIWLSVVGTMCYAAWHFITKYW